MEERQHHLWQELLAKEAKLQAAAQELQTLRTQQANEMKEVNMLDYFEFLLTDCNTVVVLSGRLCDDNTLNYKYFSEMVNNGKPVTAE